MALRGLSSLRASAEQSVAVAMSGGVDSTVAAYLMLSRGFNVTGVFMENWDEREEWGQCTAEDDYAKVKAICKHLGIASKRIRLVKDYWNEVFETFLSQCELGLTPNPDVLCNRHIKFGSFLTELKNAGYSRLATGHYARLDRTTTSTPKLLAARDRTKDQSYFLATVPASAFANVDFPLGIMFKSDVKDLARRIGLEWVARQRESMGLCFVGRRKFSNFIGNYLDEKPGHVVDESGRILAQHSGLFYYTIGQRARIAGLKSAHYVVDKKLEENRLVVAPGRNHPTLHRDVFTVGPVYWQSVEGLRVSDCEVRVRHGAPLVQCSVKEIGNGRFLVSTLEPVWAVTPGQFAVFYLGNTCLGGGVIQSS